MGDYILPVYHLFTMTPEKNPLIVKEDVTISKNGELKNPGAAIPEYHDLLSGAPGVVGNRHTVEFFSVELR